MRTPQASPLCLARSNSSKNWSVSPAREDGACPTIPTDSTAWGAPKVLGVEIVLDVPDATSKRDAIVYYEVSYTAERVIAESLYRLRSTDEEAVFIRDGQDVELYCDLDGNDFVQAVARTVQRNRLLLEVLANSEADEVGGGVAGVIQWFKRLTVIRSS